MLRSFLLILILLLSLSFLTYGQEMAIGDSSVVSAIRGKASSIYNNKDTTLFFLTKQPLQKTTSCGISMVVYIKNDSINRVVTSATTTDGILSAEYYLDHEQLVFSYITFEYFDEVKAITTREDFKGIKSWESRYYFTNEQIKYQTHSGIKEQSAIYPASEVLNDKRSILDYIKGRMKW